MKIRVCTDYNEWNNKHYYTNFEVVDKLPEIGEVIYGDRYNDFIDYGERELITNVSEIRIDCAQDNDDVYSYDFYDITTQLDTYDWDSKSWTDSYTSYDILHFALKKEN